MWPQELAYPAPKAARPGNQQVPMLAFEWEYAQVGVNSPEFLSVPGAVHLSNEPRTHSPTLEYVFGLALGVRETEVECIARLVNSSDFSISLIGVRHDKEGAHQCVHLAVRQGDQSACGVGVCPRY